MSDHPVRLSDMSARQLVAFLDEQYPHRCVARGETIEDANRYAGTRELIDELVTQLAHEDQEDQESQAAA